jgi:hypothetical protein
MSCERVAFSTRGPLLQLKIVLKKARHYAAAPRKG